MNIPTIFDWIARFEHLRGQPAVLIILFTATMVALFWDWRIALFSLIGQYLAAALLFVDLLEPRLAIIKVFVGMFVCLILYWTARQISYGALPHQQPGGNGERADNGRKPLTVGRWTISYRTAVRTAIVVFTATVLALVVNVVSFSLPGVPQDMPYINQAVLILMVMGILGVIVGGDPLAAGMSLFTFITGFELYFASFDQSATMLAALAALNFVLALAVAYLSQVGAFSLYKVSND